MRALNPDISIVHGCVADSGGQRHHGASPWGRTCGALASTGGVLATVERIVPVEYIREYAALVKIPSYCVKAVCVAPMGLHPFSLPNPGIRDFSPYEKDVEFLNELHEASKSDETLDAWIGNGSIDCRYPSALPRQTGAGQDGCPDARDKRGLDSLSPVPVSRSDCKGPLAPEEMVLVALMREIVASVRKSGHRMILSGAGSRGGRGIRRLLPA